MRREDYQLTAEGFKKLYEKKVRVTKTYKQAYEEAEIEHEKMFKRKRYNGYNSFRNVKNKR